MRVEPIVSTASNTQINLGGGLLATVFDQQQVQTTVLAGDGETVAIGGLIAKNNSRQENKIPWFGDLPLVGAAFRFRTQNQFKRELLVILTPHVVRCEADAARILIDEARKMDWVTKEVDAIHASSRGPGPFPPSSPTVVPGTVVPGYYPQEPGVVPGHVLPVPQPLPGGTVLPTPAPAPMPSGPVKPPTPTPLPKTSAAPPQQPVMLAGSTVVAPNGPAPLVNPFEQSAASTPAAQPAATTNGPMDGSVQKEKKGWSLFRRSN